MTRSTSELRRVWAPPCEGPFARVTLYGGGRVVVDPLIVPAVKALDACLRAHRYEATAPDVGAYNCRAITGGTAYSLHAFGIAIDINWQANPYGPRLITDMPAEMVAAIKAIRTNGGHQVWRWGGDYSGNKDAMHFEVVASPVELATGIDSASEPEAQEDDDMIDPAKFDLLYYAVTTTVSEAIGRIEAHAARNTAQIAGLAEAVKTLAAGQGLDPAELERVVRDGAEAALRDVLGSVDDP